MLKRLCLSMLIGAVSFIPAPSADAQDIDRDAVVAVVDGETITFKDLDAFSRKADPRRLFLLNQQLQESRRGLADPLGDDRLVEAEAARTGVTVNELLNQRLKVAPVTDAEILRAFKQVREQQPAVTLKQMRPVITMQLQGRHRAEAKARLIQELRQAAR